MDVRIDLQDDRGLPRPRGASVLWDASRGAVNWLRANIPGAVAQFSEGDEVLILRTAQGERHVRAGWWIHLADDGTVSIAPGAES